MKVLMLHNRYKIAGGEDVSTEAEYNLLKSQGVDIEIMYINNDTIDDLSKISLAINTIWSRKYYKEILQKIQSEKYDIIHVQNFFPLFSPSIFYAAQKTKTKIIMTVRNYRLICPNGLMYVHDNLCNTCIGKKIPYPAIHKKCYRDSVSATTVAVAMLSTHNMLSTWNKKVDGFICISEFVKDQLILGNFNKNALHVKYNFVSTGLNPNFTPESYYVFAGRLSTEKGIDILLDAFKSSGRKLLIIGDGPLKEEVLDSANKHPNIVYLGKQPLSETYKIISNAKALIFPSKWHEPFGRTIVESFAHGTPVIGAALGGVTELVKNNENGFLFNPHKRGDLLEVLAKFEHSTDHQKMRENAFMSYKANFSPETNYTQLLKIYNTVIENKNVS